MSQEPHETIDVQNPAINTAETVGDYQYPPQLARNLNQESRGTSDFVDGSGHIFSMYLEMATEEDKKMAENWKDDADGILIFTGLFSAAVASLISVSIQDLQQNPQDTSNFYLANIYQATIHPNESSSLPTSPPPFIPPNHAIWVNAFWFLSLVISITCALLATLLQQWARRYLKVTQLRYSPHKRARIRAFFAEGVDKFLLPWAVEALPTMLHLALFLFFAGLAVFLWNVNLTIFKLVLSWIGLCTALYGCITFIPIFCHDSPYHTPLSLPVWHVITGIPFLTFRALEKITSDYFSAETNFRFWDLAERYENLLVRGMQKMAEESAYNSPSNIDTRAFMWTFDCLDEDHELERFFAGLPGFRGSKMVEDPLPDLTSDQCWKLVDTLIELSDRTSSSDLLPEQVKIRRTIICRKAIGPADIPYAMSRAFHRIASEGQYGRVQSAEIAGLVSGWDNGEDEETTAITQAVVSGVVARAQRHDDLWFTVASNEMRVSESVLRNYATHGSNLSLATLNHIIRQQFSIIERTHWIWEEFSKVLSATSKFDVLDTSPELQHKFCALWNKVVSRADGDIPRFILRRIRNVYLMLHLDTDCAPTEFTASTSDNDAMLNRASSYPLCTIPGHHPDTHHTDTESLHKSTASRDTADPSVQAMAPVRHEPSLSTSSVSPSVIDFFQNNTDFLAPSGALESPSSASHGPSPIVKIATVSPGVFSWPTSVHEQDTAAITAEGSPEDALSGDKNAIDPTLENRGSQADINAIPDLSSHASGPPLLPSTPDIAAVGPSQS